MAINGWAAGARKQFILLTNRGEGSCFDSTSTSCSYTEYCAYHTYTGTGTGYAKWANMPYNGPNCYAGTPTPNGMDADVVLNPLSHEMFEAWSDPLLNAWYDASGYENGDECAWYFGPITKAGGTANEVWNGHPYVLQTEPSLYLERTNPAANACKQ